MRHATAEGAQHSSPVCLLPSSHMLPISCIHSRMPSSPGSLSHSSPVRDPCHSLLTPHCTSIPALTPSPSSLSCPSEQAQCTGVQGIAQCEECGQRKEVALQTSEGSPPPTRQHSNSHSHTPHNGCIPPLPTSLARQRQCVNVSPPETEKGTFVIPARS